MRHGRMLSVVSITIVAVTLLTGACPCEVNLSVSWNRLTTTVADRMSDQQAAALTHFLNNLQTPTPQLQALQNPMPNSTVALLGAVQSQGLLLAKAEQIAAHLNVTANKMSGRELRNYDQNTAQAIERNWQEVAKLAAL